MTHRPAPSSEKGFAASRGAAPAAVPGGDAAARSARAPDRSLRDALRERAASVSVTGAPVGHAPPRLCVRCAIKARVREFLVAVVGLGDARTARYDARVREFLVAVVGLGDARTARYDARLREDFGLNVAALCHLAGDLERHFGIEIAPRAEFGWLTLGDVFTTVVPLLETRESAGVCDA